MKYLLYYIICCFKLRQIIKRVDYKIICSMNFQWTDIVTDEKYNDIQHYIDNLRN